MSEATGKARPKVREGVDWGKLAPLRLRARLVADGVYAGGHRSIRRGAGVEFGGHRSYVPGDDLRFLDRHARMRHGVLLVRQFETETDRALRVIVDASASMAYRSEGAPAEKYAYAAVLAAALGRIAVIGGDRVALDFVAGERCLPLPSTGGREAFERLVGHLESANTGGEGRAASFEQALGPAYRHSRRGAAIVLLSDLLDLPDGAPDLLAGLCVGGRAVVAVRVLDPAEIEFPFRGPITLEALEGATLVETEGEGARAAYLEALAALAATWETRLLARGGRLVLASTADDPVLIVRNILAAMARAGEGVRGAA
jgi:uncharacterized protein (DUF58 family)